jgi:hypothetical protein
MDVAFIMHVVPLLRSSTSFLFMLGFGGFMLYLFVQVDIWEERKVFGSRGRSLKDEMLSKNPSVSVSNGKSSNPIKIVKRDANSVRIVST